MHRSSKTDRHGDILKHQYRSLEQRSRPLLALCLLVGALFQCALVAEKTSYGIYEFQQRLHVNTAAELANFIQTSASATGTPLQTSFVQIAAAVRILNPGTRLLVVDESGEIIAAVPPGLVRTRISPAPLELSATSKATLTFPHLIEDPTRASGEAPFVAARLTTAPSKIFLVVIPPVLAAGSEAVEAGMNRLGMALSILYWATSFLALACFLRFGLGRAIARIATTPSGPEPEFGKAINPRRVTLTHELSELRFAAQSTRSHLLETTRERQRLDAERQLLVARLVHDLRTPYTALSGYAEMCGSVGAAPTAETVARVQSRFLPHLQLAVGRIQLLASTVKDFANLGGRLQTFSPRYFSAVEIANESRDVLTPLARVKKIDLDIESDEDRDTFADGGRVWGDPALVSRALTNLLDNAVKYTPKGGRVKLRLSYEGGTVRFSVSDTGIGIPPECLPRLGKDYYRLSEGAHNDPGGTGLGLSNVRQLLLLHKADLSVTSTPEVGSEFSFALRCVPRDEPDDAVPVLHISSPETVPSRPQHFVALALLSGFIAIVPIFRPAVLHAQGIAPSYGGFAIALVATAFLERRGKQRLGSIGLVTSAALAGLVGMYQLLSIPDGVLILGAAYVTFGILGVMALRNRRVLFSTFYPLILPILYGEFQRRGGGLLLFVAPTIVLQLLWLIGGESDRSRQLGTRVAFGFAAVFVILSVPSAAYYSRIFEHRIREAVREGSRDLSTRLGAFARSGVGTSSDAALAMGTVLSPEADALPEGDSYASSSERLSNMDDQNSVQRVPFAAEGQLVLHSPSLRTRLLASRALQGHIAKAVIASVVVLLATAMSIGLWIHRRVAERLQTLANGCRDPHPEVALAAIRPVGHHIDEIDILQKDLQALYESLQSRRIHVERAAQRQATLLNQMADVLLALLGRNQSAVTELEEASRTAPSRIADQASILRSEVAVQLSGIQRILDLMKPISSVEPVGSIDRAHSNKLLMEIAASANRRILAKPEASAAKFELALSEAAFSSIISEMVLLLPTRDVSDINLSIKCPDESEKIVHQFTFRTAASVEDENTFLSNFCKTLQFERLQGLIEGLHGGCELSQHTLTLIFPTVT